MHQVEAGTGTAAHTTGHGLLRRLGIYIFMVVWAVSGLAYTDVVSAHTVPFWLLTTILFAIIAIVHVLRSDAEQRTVLALKQLAHWAAFFVAMVLLHSQLVGDLVAGDPSIIVVLILLALATFLDGIYVDWRFCVVGLVLASGSLVVAWLDDWALVLTLTAVVVVAIGALYLLRHFGSHRFQG
ncbi:MAG: hypothetical protein AB7I59_10240 [Geminicoccaceae bacterium]